MLVNQPQSHMLEQALRSSTELAGGGRLLNTILLDDSRSILHNLHHVISGYNEWTSILCKAPGKVLMRTDFLNNKSTQGFMLPSEVAPLNPSSYLLSSGTPLFFRAKQTLESVLDATEGHPEDVTMTFLFTDGWDTKSKDHGVCAADVKALDVPMFQSGRHVIGAFAVDDGHTDFWQVFNNMGIPQQWIMVLNDWKDVREKMSNVGKSVSRASRSRDDFKAIRDGGC